ncbi:transglutaminase-like domain-containing protein [Streptomyces katsurahamanus]|uniref:Tetratricopeptide repeat protein n=1 Tax=Streptomyces katsurahamanus TaxID=2577098 RepID=A0ABW9NQE9_9ACTN|nr:transglutaminase-like domain-containing protein [Streptomyces katsurahamanus]MQS35528.1 tetratricopeptide repeat protein [Streptomyces katsurahamanus]
MHDDSAGSRSRFAEEARSERPDLTLLCLLIGAVADPSLDEAGMDAAQVELDRLAGMLPYGPKTPAGWAAALAGLLGDRCGFRGSSADYRRLESSLLHEVLRRRRGLPILLSTVWTEVARRAGAPVYGVALPGHFVVGFGDPEGSGERVLADPFAGGRPLTGAEAELMAVSATGAPLDPSALRPAATLDVVQRILNNIQGWATARPEQSAVALWAVELSLLLPSHPVRLRFERAELLIQRGDFLAGAAELDAYAEAVSAVEPATAEAVRGRARAARAMLN